MMNFRCFIASLTACNDLKKIFCNNFNDTYKSSSTNCLRFTIFTKHHAFPLIRELYTYVRTRYLTPDKCKIAHTKWTTLSVLLLNIHMVIEQHGKTTTNVHTIMTLSFTPQNIHFCQRVQHTYKHIIYTIHRYVLWFKNEYDSYALTTAVVIIFRIYNTYKHKHCQKILHRACCVPAATFLFLYSIYTHVYVYPNDEWTL